MVTANVPGSLPGNPAFSKAPGRRASRLDMRKTFTKELNEIESSAKYDPSLAPTDYAKKFLDFQNANPTIYHYVHALGQELEKAGFTYVSERESWASVLTKTNKIYTTRNGTSIAAYVIGSEWKPGNGVGFAGSHVDSLSAKIKPISIKPVKDGYVQLGVAPYAGGLNSTWWDRDLGFGGRVLVKVPSSSTSSAPIQQKLIRFPYPVARIPTLAPHFGISGPFNLETQTVPIVGLATANEEEPEPTADEKAAPLYGKHDLRILRKVAELAEVEVKDLLQLELELFEHSPGTVGGLNGEFLFCPRLDDKLCAWTSIFGLIEALPVIEKSSVINVAVGYDNEEIGSRTRQGAQGDLVELGLHRILAIYGQDDDDIKAQTIANSFFISSDVSHSVNPNFSDLMAEHYKPQPNAGIIVCSSSIQNLATDPISTCFVEEVARRTGNPLQYEQAKNDVREGGSIGPIISTRLGVRCADVGLGQLSMHSIRAACGSKDIWIGVRFYRSFFEVWDKVDEEFKSGQL